MMAAGQSWSPLRLCPAFLLMWLTFTQCQGVPLPPIDAATTPTTISPSPGGTRELTEVATVYGSEETVTELIGTSPEEGTAGAGEWTGGDDFFLDMFKTGDFSWDRYLCDLTHRERTSELTDTGVAVCNASHDGLLCWPSAVAGENVSVPCPNFNTSLMTAYRTCEESGNWAEWTNYNECLKTFTVPTIPGTPVVHTTTGYIWLFGCILSLIFLTVTLFIFSYFRSLRCTRINIHKNLAVSFILKYIIMITMLQPFLSAQPPLGEYFSEGNDIPYAESDSSDGKPVIFCRLLKVLLEYFTMANIFWMFVEGLFLTSRIAVAVFSNESNFKLYFFIGWGSPLFFTIGWAILMVVFSTEPCWDTYHELPYIWLIRVPMILAIVVNSFFLINIIRILVTKLRASNSVETAQMRKSVKAVAVLFPLLGLTYLIFIWEVPSEGGIAEMMYHTINAILQSGQGVFVAVIYCFMNAEVRMAIRRRIAKSRYTFGIASRRRTHTNGSCVIATSSEVVLSVNYRKNVQASTSVDQLSQEMKPFTENAER